MSYRTHATIARDPAIRERLMACAATQGVTDPQRWVNAVAFHLVGSDWVAAWQSAQASGNTDPGADEAVVTDQALLSAVQARLASEAPDAAAE